ncbi:MAG: pre-peptidase C-terminal domain-containing protein, partial [Thermoguttaceae bacterium]
GDKHKDDDDDGGGKGSKGDAGELIAEAVAAAPGEDVVLQTVATHGRLGAAEGEDTEPRMYMVSVGGADGTTGEYTVHIILNAAVEEEVHGGQPNDDLESAQNINGSFLLLADEVSGRNDDRDRQKDAQASRGAVLGHLDGWATTVPGDLETLEGNSGNAAPFNMIFYDQSEMRYQQIYSASEFSTSEGFIDQLRFRRSRFYDTFGPTDIDVTIRLGHAATTVQTISTTFAENVGEGYVTVFDGVATISSEGIGLPNPFDIVIDVDNLFRYDPAVGDLLVDITIHSELLTTFFDASGFGEQLTTRRVYTNAGDADVETGVVDPAILGPAYGLVTQFAFVNDTDVYGFTLREGENASIALTALSEGDVALQLLDASGEEIATGITGATNVDAIIKAFTATEALRQHDDDGDEHDDDEHDDDGHDRSTNTYYVRVSGGADVDYSLLIARNALFDTEANDTLTEAQAMGDLDVAFGHVGGSDDTADVYSVDVSAGQQIRVSTSTPADLSGEFTNLLDPVLVLYGPSGLVAAEGTALADGRNEELVYAIPDGGEGTYYVMVTGADPVINPDGGEYVIRVEQSSAPGSGAKFFVVDTEADGTYQYDPDGELLTDTELADANESPRGITSNLAGTRQWVIDRNGSVYVYDAQGDEQGAWRAGGLRRPTGIATDEQDIWIVDARRDRVYQYDGAAALTSGQIGPDSSFRLSKGNGSPTGITSDGNFVWVVNSGRSKDAVFKYTVDGQLQGSWVIDRKNSRPTGITIDPSDVDHIWIVDARKDQVFQYEGAAFRTSGKQAADARFDLAEGNTNPQGIADPPPTVTPVDSTSQGRTLDPAALSAILQADSIRGTIASSSPGNPSHDGRIDVALLQFAPWFEDATDDDWTSDSRDRIRPNVSDAVDRLMADLDRLARRSEGQTAIELQWSLSVSDNASSEDSALQRRG